MGTLALSSAANPPAAILGSAGCCGGKRRKPRVSSLRAALVEAGPRPVPAVREGGRERGNDAAASTAVVPVFRQVGAGLSVPSFRDRAEDMQAEARAMTRASNVSVYSPELLSTKYGSRPIKVLRRTAEILFGLGSFAAKLWLDQFRGELDRNKRLRAVELREILTGLGPTFVKIGQGLSTRPDLCPPEYLEELSQLQVYGSQSSAFVWLTPELKW